MSMIPDPRLVFFRPWIVATLTDLQDVIFEDQSPAGVPRPIPKPYASMRIAVGGALTESSFDEMTDTVGTEDPNLFVMQRSQKDAGTLRVSLWGDGAYSRARRLQLSLRDQLTRDTLAPDGHINYALNRLGPILNLTLMQRTEFDPKAQVDFRYMLIDQSTQELPVIETVNVPLNP